jgi:outer membrane biosynthesis protein TonB
MLARFTDRIKEHGTPERAPLLEGKSMHLTVASLHKPKEHEAPVRAPRGHQPETGAQAPAAAQQTQPKTDDQPASTPAAEAAEAPKPEPTPQAEPAKAATPEPEPEPTPQAEPAKAAKPEPEPEPEPGTKEAERPKATASAARSGQSNGTARGQSAPRAPQRTTNDTPAEPAATGE